MVVALALLWPALPASAHSTDPRIETTLDGISPALPSGVIVQAQAGLAAELVVQNPTQTPLEVVGTGGRVFLRISARGVFGDVSSPDFRSTSLPDGVPPRSAGTSAPRFLQLSAGDSWGWYDHRLHPAALPAPADPTRPARLGDFTVPLRYGATPTTVRGHVSFRPLLGSYTVTADAAPQGLTVQALPGTLPGLFVSDPGAVPLTVMGRDGEPFLRFGSQGVEVNVHSRTHVEDRQARGDGTAGPVSTVPRFALVAPGASSHTWLDGRLRYPADLPSDAVARASAPTVVRRWRVPVSLAGRPAALTGRLSWIPQNAAAAAVRSRGVAPPPDRPLLPLALAGAGGLVVVAAVIVLRLRRSRAGSRSSDGHRS